ncbi:hypothetical protein FKM82_010274 [Ascaphus truei]
MAMGGLTVQNGNTARKETRQQRGADKGPAGSDRRRIIAAVAEDDSGCRGSRWQWWSQQRRYNPEVNCNFRCQNGLHSAGAELTRNTGTGPSTCCHSLEVECTFSSRFPGMVK